jgi:hypothetical protein
MKAPAATRLPHPVLLLLASAILTVAVYWTGLNGPLLLDDHYNLEVIQRWLDGNATLQEVLFGGRSGTFGRPLAMASLALNAWLGGYQPFAFKLGNLLVHLLVGVVSFALVRRIALRDPRLSGHASLVAAAIAALWLLHPLNASTVLYAVQRMAQLSVLCMLTGLWLYMAMRERLESRPTQAALIVLFAGMPLLLVAGFLSKENAIVLPALCLVLELGSYREQPRPGSVKVFFAAFLLLPFLVGLLALILEPARLLGGYAQRDFDWQQRLLSEGRALCDYLWRIVVPNPPRMGVYTDDFVASTGLMSPPTTLLAILALAAITFAAWRLRSRIPALFIGWGIFLVGHAFESSIVPLELYYEHRNYLPMVGVLYALVGLAMAAGDALRKAGLRPGRIGLVLATGLLALLAFGTHGRARVWSTAETLALNAVASHPQSLRANMALVKVALDHDNREVAGQALQRLIEADNPRTRALGYLNRLYLACALNRNGDPGDLAQALDAMPPRMTFAEPELFGLLLDNTAHGCGAVDHAMLGNGLATMLDRAREQPDGLWVKWRLRHMAARFFARASDWTRAREQAQLAWQPGADPAVAELLVRTQLATGDIAGAERTYAEARLRVDPKNPQDAAGMRALRARIDTASAQRNAPDAK